MEEAIASSQIEGAVTTRKVAKEMLRAERKPRNRSEQMILNNYYTIKRIGEIRDKKLTIDLILEIHKLITNRTLDNDDDEGRFRLSNDVKVVDGITGEVVHHPPDFKSLNFLMNNFCQFANEADNEKFIHPIIRASILHFLIGYIHPFADGNGRTARAIFYWNLLSKGYWLIEYMSISRLIIKSKTQYAKAYLYSELDSNDITYFIKYKIRTIEQAFESLKDYISRKIKEKSQLYDFRKIKGVNDRQLQLIRIFLDDPEKIMTIKEVQNRFGIVYQTARTDLIGLVDLKLLETFISGKKKITYFRSEKFDKELKDLCK
jgi:Fic family protein